MLLVKKCRLADDSSLIDLYVNDGHIAHILPAGSQPPFITDQEIDAQGRLLTPGLIDVHIQGAGGANVLTGSSAALAQMARTCARLGTTGFLATTVAQRENANLHLPEVARFMRQNPGDGAHCYGIHLEGPFINIKRQGGIAAEYIFPPTVMGLDEILDRCEGVLAMMTIAPELPGHLAVIDQLVERQVVAALGHTDATLLEACAGFEHGISHVTHLFNAMPPIHHRAPGSLVAVLNHDTVSAQIISDGVHVHPAVVKLLFRILRESRCILITDGMEAIGLPEGRYWYGDTEYESKDGTARRLDGTLIGSTLSLMDIVQRFRAFTGCSLQTAVNCASLYPARLLGLAERKGSVAVGKDADLVVWNSDYSVHTTIIDGRIISNSPE